MRCGQFTFCVHVFLWWFCTYFHEVTSLQHLSIDELLQVNFWRTSIIKSERVLSHVLLAKWDGLCSCHGMLHDEVLCVK